MNHRKIWRKIANGDEFYPSDSWMVRRAIAEALVVFFTRLNQLRTEHPDATIAQDANENHGPQTRR